MFIGVVTIVTFLFLNIIPVKAPVTESKPQEPKVSGVTTSNSIESLKGAFAKMQVEIKEYVDQAKLKTKKVALKKVYADGICFDTMRQVWPEELWEGATIVIQKESSGDPNAISSTNDYGCFQIHDEPAALDPIVSAQRGYQKYQHPRKISSIGWNHWYAVEGILW